MLRIEGDSSHAGKELRTFWYVMTPDVSRHEISSETKNKNKFEQQNILQVFFNREEEQGVMDLIVWPWQTSDLDIIRITWRCCAI